MKLPSSQPAPPPRPRKPFRCPGCGGLTDGRHIDRELLSNVRAADAAKEK